MPENFRRFVRIFAPMLLILAELLVGFILGQLVCIFPPSIPSEEFLYTSPSVMEAYDLSKASESHVTLINSFFKESLGEEVTYPDISHLSFRLNDTTVRLILLQDALAYDFGDGWQTAHLIFQDVPKTSYSMQYRQATVLFEQHGFMVKVSEVGAVYWLVVDIP